MSKTLVKLTLEIDTDTVNPFEYGGWQLYTFFRNSYITDVKDPSKYIKGPGIPATNGLRRKLESGLAHWVSRYSHGQDQWGLLGEVFQCQWDTTQYAGILIWEENWRNLGRDKEKRAESARATLKEYTRWADGDCWWYSVEKIVIEDDDFDPECDEVEDFKHEVEDISSCGGFIGTDSVYEAVSELLNHEGLTDLPMVFAGNGKEAYKYYDFSKKKGEKV